MDTCWYFAGSLNRDGYGMIRGFRAHRVMFENTKGVIPDGLVIDHICNHPSCINPQHLRAVTHATNIMRGNAMSARNRRKTHCDNGHEFTPENTYIRPQGWRKCRTCKRIEWLKYQPKQKAVRAKSVMQ